MALTFPSNGPNQDSGHILRFLSQHSGAKFGPVFYRGCSYDDDTRWSSFMARMKGWAIEGLESEVQGIAIKDRLSLEMVEDPELVGVSKDEIRGRHKEWIAASGELRSNIDTSRLRYPIYVDQASLESVLNGCEPGAITGREIMSPSSYVIMIDTEFEIPEATEEDKADGIDHSDDGCPPIDGCRMEDVGWMKVTPFDLIPRLYALMMEFGWDSCYRRPPHFAKISF